MPRYSSLRSGNDLRSPRYLQGRYPSNASSRASQSTSTVRFSEVEEHVFCPGDPDFHPASSNFYASPSILYAPRQRVIPLPTESTPDFSHQRKISVRIESPGMVEWDRILSTVKPLLEDSTLHSSELSIVWKSSNQYTYDFLGVSELCSLFSHLNGSRRGDEALSSIRSASIRIPKRIHDSLRSMENVIQLHRAFNLQELSWSGDFSLLAQSFCNIPSARLGSLRITGCLLSLDDTIAILHDCPSLVYAEFETLEDQAHTGNLYKSGHSIKAHCQHLEVLSIASSTPLDRFFESFSWGEAIRLEVSVSGRGAVGLPVMLRVLRGNTVHIVDIRYPRTFSPPCPDSYQHLPIFIQPV